MHRMTTRHDDLDDTIPRCPLCNARVYKTHRCTARSIELVPMPSDFRARAAAAKAQASHPEAVGVVEPLPFDE